MWPTQHKIHALDFQNINLNFTDESLRVIRKKNAFILLDNIFEYANCELI